MRRRGCDSRRAHQPSPAGFGLAGQFLIRWAPACAVESPKLNEVGAAPTHRANSRGHMCRSGETVSQSVCGGCNSHCLHQFTRAMIRPAVCRTAVIKEGRKTTSGALPPSPTSSRLGRGTADSPACRAGDSGGSTRPGRHSSGTRKIAIHPAWDRETLGAEPRCPTISTPRSSDHRAAHF